MDYGAYSPQTVDATVAYTVIADSWSWSSSTERSVIIVSYNKVMLLYNAQLQ